MNNQKTTVVRLCQTLGMMLALCYVLGSVRADDGLMRLSMTPGHMMKRSPQQQYDQEQFRQYDVNYDNDVFEDVGRVLSNQTLLGGSAAQYNGLYFVEVELGNPVQKLQTLFFTYGSFLGVSAGECKGCSGVVTKFNATRSNTSSLLPCSKCNQDCIMDTCQFKHEFIDAAYIDGTVYEDELRIQKISANLSFGYITSRSDVLFGDQHVAGVLGMALDRDTTDGMDSVLSTLAQNNKMPSQFSTCMGQYGGDLVIGGTDSSQYVGNLSSTKLLSNAFFTVASTGVFQANNNVTDSIDSINPTVFHSGLRHIYLPSTVYNNLRDAMVDNICPTSEVEEEKELRGLCITSDSTDSLFSSGCLFLSDEDVAQFSNISLFLAGNVQLNLTPQQYMYRTDNGMTCLGLEVNHYSSGMILGTLVNAAYFTEYNEADMTIGFAVPLGCEYADYVLEYRSGDDEKAWSGREVGTVLSVAVLHFGTRRPVEGIKVTMKVLYGNGTLVSMNPVTNANGVASTSLIAGESVEENLVMISLDGALNNPMIFRAMVVQSPIPLIMSSVFLVLLIVVFVFMLYVAKKWKVVYERRKAAKQMAVDIEDESRASHAGVKTSSMYHSAKHRTHRETGFVVFQDEGQHSI
eukprot:TRINITY_DN12863_c0_g1_i1.p1 TRINITY_DN12863_c0_g1~~TRINITY_DN12863_c0_g1_i1.p1  ORF type:complete len:632 (+),score=127.43 TRINITY_DN12863_c0_g1_i1:223-2118(+)